MPYVPLIPAEPAFAADGTPWSSTYGDVYHSTHGGPAQACHVFLAGNGLPARWRERETFVILETGFGLGLNFLVTWDAWRISPGKRLHYVAIEKHPFAADALAALHARWPELESLAAALRQRWPPLLPGLHRLDFGDVVLTLGFGDADDLLPQLQLAADAFYLDGFAPEKNPALWSAAVIAELRRLAAPAATLATWTVAGEIRRRLASADFALEKRPGFGGKRDMLAGRFVGAPVVRRSTPAIARIAVIGAGIAGASVARALARRHADVVVVDAADGPARGASGNLAGVVRPLPSLDDGRLARVLRAGFLLGQRQLDELPAVRQGRTGVLHIARDARHEATQRRIAAEHRLPPDYCRFVEREEATALAGWPVAFGGWWFSRAGWLNPPGLCRALLDGIDCRYGESVAAIEQGDHGWALCDARGRAMLTADAVVVANGVQAPALLPAYCVPIRYGRGVVSHLPADATPRMDIVATRIGYVTPAIDGVRCAGATLATDDTDAMPRPADHAENLQRLAMILPGYGAGLDPARLDGRAAFRPLSPDRLPLVGALGESPGLWLIDGFGARGLVFAPIAAELLASLIAAEPLPLEADLVAALAPSRFPAGRRAVPPAPTL